MLLYRSGWEAIAIASGDHVRQFHHILNYLRDGTLPIGALA